MNKHSGYETYRPIEAPFSGLIAPSTFVSEGIFSALAEACGFVARTLRRWHDEIKIARTAAELSKLADHILDDIGVRRDEIEVAARQVVENPGVDFRTAKASRN